MNKKLVYPSGAVQCYYISVAYVSKGMQSSHGMSVTSTLIQNRAFVRPELASLSSTTRDVNCSASAQQNMQETEPANNKV